MRVVSGTMKGRTLKSPKGIRPVTGMIKAAVFNILQTVDWADSAVLDLFAGAGNFGIEAISRGARRVVFADKSAESRRVIGENLRGVEWSGEVLVADVADAIKKLFKKGEKFTIIVADPPFDREYGSVVARLLDTYPLLEPGGRFVLRVRDTERVEFPESMDVVTRTYGDSVVYFAAMKDRA